MTNSQIITILTAFQRLSKAAKEMSLDLLGRNSFNALPTPEVTEEAYTFLEKLEAMGIEGCSLADIEQRSLETPCPRAGGS